MKNGIIGLDLEPGARAAAPASGVQFGRGQDGPVSLRLFRVTGTRVVVATRVLPAQLLVVRAGAAGVPVQIVTSRPQLWQPLAASLPGSRVLPDAGGLQPTGGPGLIVDDRPAEARAPLDIRPWQCRVDIRSQWAPSELSSLARFDLAVFGAVAPESTRAIAASFSLPRGGADPLARLDASSFALLRRSRLGSGVQIVSLDPTSAEAALLERARGFGSPGARVLA